MISTASPSAKTKVWELYPEAFEHSFAAVEYRKNPTTPPPAPGDRTTVVLVPVSPISSRPRPVTANMQKQMQLRFNLEGLIVDMVPKAMQSHPLQSKKGALSSRDIGVQEGALVQAHVALVQRATADLERMLDWVVVAQESVCQLGYEGDQGPHARSAAPQLARRPERVRVQLVDAICDMMSVVPSLQVLVHRSHPECKRPASKGALNVPEKLPARSAATPWSATCSQSMRQQ